jgi:hypothetical protein
VLWQGDGDVGELGFIYSPCQGPGFRVCCFLKGVICVHVRERMSLAFPGSGSGLGSVYIHSTFCLSLGDASIHRRTVDSDPGL